MRCSTSAPPSTVTCRRKTPGGLPIPAPYPVADFVGAPSTDTGGVPALSLGGQLGGTTPVDLLTSLKTALAAQINAFTAATPTHLGCGAQVQLDLGGTPAGGTSATTTVSADASLRIDIGRLALAAGAPAPARPAHALTASASLWRPGGWLAGDPRSYAGVAAPWMRGCATRGSG